MHDEIEIIKKQLPEMAGILNAVPDERFELKCAQTLLIVQRRMEESELQTQLSVYTHLFSKEGLANITELSNAAVAFVKIKTLCEAGKANFDQISIRELIKEFHSQRTKVLNIIHLSKVNALAAEEYQKEVIRKTLDKSERYLKAFEDEIKRAEKKIEKEPESLIKPREEKEPVAESKENPTKEKRHILAKAVERMSGIVEGAHHKKEVGFLLKEEEAKQADSRCEEIPYYDSTFKVAESYVCKDIPEFSVFVRKGNVYFGKTGNVTAGVYNNKDQSLFELMNVSQDFIQFLTTDLLSGEYELTPFGESEKKAMQLYFDFLCVCFEKYIGKLLSVQEYLRFKDYYNKLVLKMFELEKKQQDDYHRAFSLTDSYMSYMKSYDLTVSEEKEDIVRNIIAGKNLNYVGDLELILEIHVVCEEARKALLELIESIHYFHGKTEEIDENCNNTVDEVVDFQGAKIVIEVVDEAGKLMDVAYFSARNLDLAVSDFMKKDVPGKRMGIEKDGIRTYFFAGKIGGMAIPIITTEIRSAWNDEERIYFESLEKELNKTMIRIGGYSK